MLLSMAGSVNEGRRRSVASCQLIFVGVAACAIMLAARGGWAVQSCQECDQCMQDCVCQTDGSCEGTPKSNTTSCEDGDPCTVNDHCQNGSCVGGGNAPDATPCNDPNPCIITAYCQDGTCVDSATKKAGDSCTYPNGGLCTGTCQDFQVGIFCMPPCLDACHFCEPSTGECTLNLCSSMPCSTGQCDSSGGCIPEPDGHPCDDGNVCTSNAQCQDGECKGTAGGTPPPAGTATPTPTGTPVLTKCVGDCNDNGVVTVAEILTGVNIALGNLDVSVCENFDANDDGLVTVDEILTAVNAALNGCPEVPATATPQPTHTSLPTNTPTATPQPTHTSLPTSTPTATTHITGTVPPTQTPVPTTPGGGTPSIGARASGTIESTTSAFLVIPNLLSALLGHLPSFGLSSTSGTASSFPGFPVSFSCSPGGGQVDCNQPIQFPLPPPTFTVTLNNCQVTTSTGATLTVNGGLTAVGQQGDTCVALPTSPTITTQNLTVQTQTAAGSTTATFGNDFSATVGLSCSSGSCTCTYDTVDLELTGTITVVSKDAIGNTLSSTQEIFYATSVSISVDQYGNQCVPKVYDMEVNGDVTLTTNGSTFAATYSGYTIHDDASSGHDMVEVSGAVTSACFGDTVIFSPSTDIALGNPCPSAGVVDVYATTSGNTDEITYSNSGVHIDFGAGGSADFGNCLDSHLFACPAS